MSNNADSIDPKEVAPTGYPAHGHNPSMQQGVDENPDLTLHYSHEHPHKHVHHGRTSIAGRNDEVLYATGTTFDQHVGSQGPQDYEKHQLRTEPVNEKDFIGMDTEKGVLDSSQVDTSGSEDEKKHRVSGTYSKYKIFVHLFIWLLFTG